MNLTRPLHVLDVESTGLDPQADRIITLALVTLYPDGTRRELDWRWDPGCKIPPETMAKHGITDDMVRNRFRFGYDAPAVHGLLEGGDLAGFNLLNFDVPILWEEFNRAGINWSLAGVDIVDAGVIFKRMEPRDLSSAVKFYCGREHQGAHTATDDARATLDVLLGQLGKYNGKLPKTAPELAKFSGDNRLDLAGTVVRDDKGVARYTHRKVRGVAVKDDPGYAEWMLRSNFSEQTKVVLRELLDEIFPAAIEQEALF